MASRHDLLTVFWLQTNSQVARKNESGQAAQTATSALSKQFYALLVNAGIAKVRPHDAQENAPGRSGHRETNPLTFHPLRHTTTTLLKAGGVGDAIVRDIVGRESSVISQRYTHLDSASLRKALDHLPPSENAVDHFEVRAWRKNRCTDTADGGSLSLKRCAV